MFYRIFGKSGYGKTEYIYEKLSACVNDGRKAFLIVPEQSAVITEKEIIKRLGPSSNLYVEVINFKRLCNRVFRELGGLTSVHLDDGAKKLLMLLSLGEVSDFLHQYKNCVTAEFASKALSMSDELKTYGVTPAMLEKAAEDIKKESPDSSFASKLSDIALICEAYEARLSAIPGVCTDLYRKLCEKLSNGNFFSGCDVFFDSFYSFTAREYEIIKLISEDADNVYVSFVCEKDSSDSMFSRSTKSAKKCKELAESAGCKVCDIILEENIRHKKDGGLFLFEKEFGSAALSGKESGTVPDGEVNTVLCRDIFEEAKHAACAILTLIRSGEHFSDIAVCAKNMGTYEGIIDTVFEKAGIPLGTDSPETLSDSALFELVTSGFEAACTFKNDAILSFVKTGLSGLSEKEADSFESYVRTWNISPSLMKKDEDWTMNPGGYLDSEPDAHFLAVVNKARSKVLFSIDSLSKNISESETVKDFALAIYNLIKDIKKVSGNDIFNDGNNGTSLSLLYECLDSFVISAGNEKVTSSAFLKLLKCCGDSYDTGHIPKHIDEVRFASVDLLRLSDTKYVILMGANSGVFPSSCKSSSLLSDGEKQLLKSKGISLSEGADELVFDELFLAYRAITGASKKCFITFCAEEPGAEKLFPSPIVTAAERITGCKRKVFDPKDYENNFSGNRMLFEEYITLEDGIKKNTLRKYFSAIPEYAEKLKALAKIGKEKAYLSSEIAESLYGDKIITSYSRLEKMAGCPFSHFCTYTLSLKPEPVAELGPAEAGSIVHKILEELVPMLCTEDENGSYPDKNTARAITKQLLCEHLSKIARVDISSLPKRFVYLYNRLSEMLGVMSDQIIRELEVTSFKPSDFELNISVGGEVEAKPIDLGGCTLYITGQIDRVDVYKKDGVSYIKIIDYKTGDKSFKLKDIENGFNLQMLIYLSAICNSKKYGDVTLPAGVMYSRVTSSNSKMMLGADDEELLSTAEAKPVSSGIFLDDEEILFAMDSTEKRQFLPITSRNKEETLASAETLGELLENAVSMSAELANEIRKGKKSVEPFDFEREGTSIDPCKYCDMRPVCLKN